MILELKCTLRHDYNSIVSRMKWCSSGYTARWSQNTGKETDRRKGKEEEERMKEGERKTREETVTHRTHTEI